MNRIARTLIITAPLSLAALTLSPGIANAESPGPGPIIVMPAEPVEPGPQDIADPAPKPDPHPAPAPDDKAPVPHDDEPNPVPETPDEITDVPDCTHGCGEDPTPDLPLDSGEGNGDDEQPDFPLDGGCFEGCDLPEDDGTTSSDETGGNGPGDGTDSTGDTEVAQFETGITTPTRVDAGLGGSTRSQDENGLELAFVLIGGALVTATGAAYAARARSRKAV